MKMVMRVGVVVSGCVYVFITIVYLYLYTTHQVLLLPSIVLHFKYKFVNKQ